MRVKIKGLNWKRTKLASGQIVTYYYAWKGGPRIFGQPGTPEFFASYHEAIKSQSEPTQKNLKHLLRAYTDSQNFTSKAVRTRGDYLKLIEKIECEFGDFPLQALSDPRARDEFLSWRDKLAKSSTRQAEYTLVVLAMIFSWAKDRGKISSNPLEKIGRIYHGSRAASIWTNLGKV